MGPTKEWVAIVTVALGVHAMGIHQLVIVTRGRIVAPVIIILGPAHVIAEQHHARVMVTQHPAIVIHARTPVSVCHVQLKHPVFQIVVHVMHAAQGVKFTHLTVHQELQYLRACATLLNNATVNHVYQAVEHVTMQILQGVTTVVVETNLITFVVHEHHHVVQSLPLVLVTTTVPATHKRDLNRGHYGNLCSTCHQAVQFRLCVLL